MTRSVKVRQIGFYESDWTAPCSQLNASAGCARHVASNILLQSSVLLDKLPLSELRRSRVHVLSTVVDRPCDGVRERSPSVTDHAARNPLSDVGCKH
jgi:hypothetical protein